MSDFGISNRFMITTEYQIPLYKTFRIEMKDF
jgi:hypothetical protein